MDDRPSIVHLCERLVVLNKPSGLAVHPGWVPRTEPTAMAWVRDAIGVRVHPVHRLDRATSGVLVFALDPQAAAAVGEAFREGGIDKQYVALVRGTAPEHVVVDHAIPKTEGGPRVEAITEVRRLARCELDRCSLIEARPRTGRLHQIRRHLKHLSHPLVGDVRYGKGDINRNYRQRWGLHRLALHALTLTLPHPDDGQPLHLRAEVPQDLAEPLHRLGLMDGVEVS